MQHPWFTPGTARETLPRIRPVVERTTELYRELASGARSRPMADSPVDSGYFRRVLTMLSMIRMLADLGVRLRNPRSGEVDFPARRAGRVVTLCWEIGEPSVRFWREPGAAPHERRPVDENGPWEPWPGADPG